MVVLGRAQLERQGRVESEDTPAPQVLLVNKVYPELLEKRVERWISTHSYSDKYKAELLWLSSLNSAFEWADMSF